MNITLKTEVRGNYLKVMQQFDRDLFEALKPPIGEMKIVAFTGSKKGDHVHLRLERPIKIEWVSEIIEDSHDNEEAYFIDIGTTLPFPIQKWRHKHIVKKIDNEHSMIIDDINFEGKNKIWTTLLYPALYLGFYPRKKVYQSYFENLNL
ncbi:MAG: ligand-binding SRPBCC domain-containing protein [Saprospiraceae bacterium]|jgi:ligand-binding SRPBCC domain-containing protein